MDSKKVRVLIACDDPAMREMIAQGLNQIKGVDLIGHASNCLEAVFMARHLNADVTLVDAHLPQVEGVDGVRMSRMGGLDTATSIAEDIPGGVAVLWSDREDRALKLDPWSSTVLLCQCSGGVCTPLDLPSLYTRRAEAGKVVFANAMPGKPVPGPGGAVRASHKMLCFGGLAVAGGFGLMLTLVLAAPGFVLASVGAVTMVSGALTGAAAGRRCAGALSRLGGWLGLRSRACRPADRAE